jgi:hypothetical protein
MSYRAARLSWWWLSLLVVLLASSLSAAQTSSGVSPSSAPPPPGPSLITSLAEQIAGFFPKVDGDVLEVQGDQVTFGVGKRDGVQPGLELSLYRQGRELRHPKTGQVLGFTEEALGTMRVVQTFEAYSIARLAQGAKAAAGDRARVSAAVVSITLVPLVDGVNRTIVETATQDLVETLNKTGRFRAVVGDQIALALAQEQISPEQFLRGERMNLVAERFKVDSVLAVHFKTVDRKPFMDVRLFRPPQPDSVLTSAFYVPATIKRSSDEARFSGNAGKGSAPGQQRVKPRSLLSKLLSGDWEPTTYSTGESTIPLKEVAKFPFPVRFMDVAVSPKDGIARVVVSDGAKIYQYRLVNQAFEPDWTYSVPTFGYVTSIQLADLDGDGVFEVVVNRYMYSSTRTVGMIGFILEQTSGRPRVWVDNIGDIMLAVDDTGAGIKKTLWTQRFSSEAFFTMGQAEHVVVKEGKLVSLGPVRVADTFRPTGAAFSNVNGKTAARTLSYIDAYQRLRITNGQEELWRSTSAVGGGGMKLEVPQYRLGPRNDKSVFVYTEPTPVPIDLDGDGIDEILVPQNQNDGMLAVIYKGPAGYRLQSVSSGFEGTITAFGAVPGDSPTLVAAVVRFTNIMKTEGETQIIITLPTD